MSTDSRLRAIEKEWAKHPPKRKSYAKSPRILKSKSIPELVAMDKKISAQGRTEGSIYMHDTKTRKKLSDIGWAIRNARL